MVKSSVKRRNPLEESELPPGLEWVQEVRDRTRSPDPDNERNLWFDLWIIIEEAYEGVHLREHGEPVPPEVMGDDRTRLWRNLDFLAMVRRQTRKRLLRRVGVQRVR